MRHHEEITDHLAIRIHRLSRRLGRHPSFLPVGRQEVKDLAQWHIDNQGLDIDKATAEYQEMVIASFTGILTSWTGWVIGGVRLEQI